MPQFDRTTIRHSDQIQTGLPLSRLVFTYLHTFAFFLILMPGCSRDWPQWRGPNRDAVWHEPIPQNFPKAGLTIRWRVAVGVGFSSPVVAAGRVYVTDSELVRPKAR